MPESVYTIPAMDCPAEEALIRRRLGKLAAISDLQFDLMGRRLTVIHDGTAEAAVVAALADIGMAPAPRPSAESSSGAACADGACYTRPPAVTSPARPWWRQHGVFALSGVLAAGAEAMYFAGVKETSAPVIAVSVVSILLGGLPTLKKGWIALRTFTLNINFLMT
ncbi:MAG: heavy metal translocating P-type ATPase, partial [Acidobacteria bacterium]|nr:heavy metal translocating P-type ATPase [Acidobacteriota bacterium]